MVDIARVAFCAFSYRSPPTPVVANQPPWSTAGVSAPAGPVLRRRDRPLLDPEAHRRVHRRLQAGDADLAVTLAAVRVAGREQRARAPAPAGTAWCRPRVGACPGCRRRPGRHHRLRARAGRTDAHRAHERRHRDRDVLAEVRVVARRDVEDPQVGLGEVVGQQPEPGQDRRPAPALACGCRGSRSPACRPARRPRRRSARPAGTRGPSRAPRSRSRRSPARSGCRSRRASRTRRCRRSATVSTGSFPASHVKWTRSAGK